MDALFLLTQLLFRSFIMILPVAVAWLAFRRLALSETGNAWLYAITGLFAAFTAAGLAPWALVGRDASWLFFVMAPFCPAIWLAVVIICGTDRVSLYDVVSGDRAESRSHHRREAAYSFRTKASASNQPSPKPTLVLENPDWPDAPSAVFLHHRSEAADPVGSNVSRSSLPAESSSLRSVLSIARDMRGNGSTSHRRDRKLLPPPSEMTSRDDTPVSRAPNPRPTAPRISAENLPFLKPYPTN